MQECKAVYYGQLELIPSIICDVYILDNGTPVMSERGTADLLGMDQKTLKAVRGNMDSVIGIELKKTGIRQYRNFS